MCIRDRVRLLRVFKLYKSWHGVNNRSSTTGEDTDTKAPLKTKKTDTLLDDVAAECGISAMPTFQLYSNGVKVQEMTGADETKLAAMAAAADDM